MELSGLDHPHPLCRRGKTCVHTTDRQTWAGAGHCPRVPTESEFPLDLLTPDLAQTSQEFALIIPLFQLEEFKDITDDYIRKLFRYIVSSLDGSAALLVQMLAASSPKAHLLLSAVNEFHDASATPKHSKWCIDSLPFASRLAVVDKVDAVRTALAIILTRCLGVVGRPQTSFIGIHDSSWVNVRRSCIWGTGGHLLQVSARTLRQHGLWEGIGLNEEEPVPVSCSETDIGCLVHVHCGSYV